MSDVLKRIEAARANYKSNRKTEPTWGEEAKGAGLAFLSGTSRFVKSIPDTVNMVGNFASDQFNSSSLSRELNNASNFMQTGIDAINEAKPERVKFDEHQQIIDDDGNFHMPNSSQIVNTIIEALPQMVGYLGAGRAGAGLAGTLSNTDKARKVGEVAGFGIGGGLLGGAEAFGETRAEALNIIKQSTNPETGQAWNDDEANQLATAVATEAGANQVPVSALLNAVGLGTASLVKGGIASRVAKGSAVDVVPEALEEGSQTYFGNKAIHDNLDSSRDSSKGVLNAMALGGIVGGIQGGITSAIDRGNSVDLLNDREVKPDEGRPQQPQQEQPRQPGNGFTMEGGPTITPQHQQRRERQVIEGEYIPNQPPQPEALGFSPEQQPGPDVRFNFDNGQQRIAPTSLAALANPNTQFTMQGEPTITPQQQAAPNQPSPALQYIDQMPDETIQIIADGVPDGMTPEQFLAQQGMPEDAVIAIMERMNALPSQQVGPVQSGINSPPPLDSEAAPIVPDTQPIVEQSAPVVEDPVQVEGDSLLATGSNISADLVKAREFAEHLASKGKITPENLSDLQEYWGDADKLSGAIKSLRSVKPNRKSKYWRSSSSNTGEPVIPENIRKEMPPEINLKTDQIKELSDHSWGAVGELSLPTMKQLVGMRGKIQRISGDENVFRNGADWVDMGDGYSAIAYQKGDKVVRAFRTPDGSVGVQSLDGDGSLLGELIGDSKPFIVEQGVDKTGLASEQITQHSRSSDPENVHEAVSKSTTKAEGAPKTKVAAALPKGTIQGGAKEINRLVKVAKLGPGNKKTAVSFSSVDKKQTEESKDAVVEDATLAPEPENHGELYVKDISEKAFVVKGETKKHKDALKAMRGKWNRKHSGWMFPRKRKTEIKDAIGKLAAKDDAEHTSYLKESTGQKAEALTTKGAQSQKRKIVAEATRRRMDKLRNAALKLEEKANNELTRPRETNTHRRASMAANSQERAAKELNTARKMKAIADKEPVKKFRYLNKVTSKTQIESLEKKLHQAIYNVPRSMMGDLTENDSMGRRRWKEGVELTDKIRWAQMPLQKVNRSTLKDLIGDMGNSRGYKTFANLLRKKYIDATEGGQVTLYSDAGEIAKIKSFIRDNLSSHSIWKDIAMEHTRLEKLGIQTDKDLHMALLELEQLEIDKASRDTTKDAENNLRGKYKELDFFNTTEHPAQVVIDKAELEQGMNVLEPSAGAGHLALKAGEVVGTGSVDTVEVSPELSEILKSKGFSVIQTDFLSVKPEPKYDRIVMNPPFSKGQEIRHIRHAYQFLKPGGRLVAITSSMAGQRSDKLNKEFSEWLYEQGAEQEALPSKSFKSAINPTSVETKVVVIDKKDVVTKGEPKQDNDEPRETRTAPSATFEKGVSHTSETISRNSPQPDSSLSSPEPESKPKATPKLKTARQKRAASILGASIGDKLKPSKDFDYLTGGREYKVERIESSGETHFVSNEGGRTSIRLPVLNSAPKQGVKFEKVAAEQDEKPKDDFVDKPKFSRESDGEKQKDKPQEKPPKKDGGPSFSRSSSPGNGTVNSKDRPVKEVSFTGVDAIKRAVTRIASGLGLDPSIVVTVNTEADLPSTIRDAIERDGAHGQIRAVFHAGKVYLVAEKIKSSHDVLHSLLHEFGHLGARKLFGDDIGIAYRQLWMKLGGTQGILKHLKSLGLDTSIKPYMETAKGLEPEHRMLLLVDEFIAIANQEGVNQTLSAKVARAIKEFIGKVRSLLEAKGIIQPKEFTASDLAYLLKQVNDASRIKRSIGDIRKARKDVRFSRVDVSAETTQRFEEAIDTHGSTILDSLKKGASQSSDKFKASSLAVLTLRQLTDIGSKYFPQKMKGYLDTIHRMIAERNSDIEESHKIAKRWQKWAAKYKEMNKRLVELMHEATIRGVDPSWTQEQLRDFIKSKIIADENLVGEDMPTELSEITRWLKERIGIEEEKARGRSGDGTTKFMERAESYKRALKQIPQLSRDYAKLRVHYNQLSKEAKDLFNDVRDSYQAKSDKLLGILEDRINRAELDEAVLREMLAKLKKDFESNRLQGPYFPLARFGEFWVSAVDPNGERVFLMYETEAEAKKAATNLNDQGFDAQWGAKLESSPLTDNVSLQFVNEIITKTDDGNLPPGVKDEIYQLYLQSLPDRSLRKQFIHRKKVAGYSNDAIRAFASASIKSSYQMARLKNIDDLNDYLSEMKSATKIQDGSQGVRARLYNEMLKRHEWVMKPGNSQLSNKITGLGFVYMLGLTPAAALINTTQNMVVAFPVLASRYGAVAAAKELVKASGQFIKSGKYVSKAARLKAQREGKDAELLSIRDSLTGEEKKAYDELVELGAIDVTMSHDLAGIAENDSANYDDKWHKVMSVVSYGFHKAEVYNRESTGMAAYRLARQAGQTHRQAINYAADVIWDAHFDYSSVNRARVMQGDWMKVATQFKQYSQNMTYYLWRNMYQSMKGESADVKREARRQLLGTLGMTAILGGVSIMPALSVVYGIAEIAVAGWDDWDDDNEEPFDAEAEFKQWFAEQVGEEPANWILNGVGGKSLGSRISLNDLWFRDPQREIAHASELWTHYASQAAGPVFGGVVMNWLLAGQRMKEGEYYRGIEYMMPKAFKDMMKTYRYANDGAESRVGAYKEDFAAWELFGQSIGFTPSDLLMTYEKNNVTKQYERKILNHRSGLLYEYFKAWEAKDKEANSEVMERIRSFNKKYPEIAIKQSTIMRSVKGRLRSREESKDGILVSKRLRERLAS